VSQRAYNLAKNEHDDARGQNIAESGNHHLGKTCHVRPHKGSCIDANGIWNTSCLNSGRGADGIQKAGQSKLQLRNE
jgi:hypothetical protein